MRILWFCIPAYGHTNPTIEVLRELVRRGHEVHYWSFDEFRERIEGAGATFVRCDGYLPTLDARTERRLRKVSTTEMSLQSFETTARMDGDIAREVAEFQPDLVVSDSACFWGKLTAQKHHLPLVTSTTTFAFNRHSSQYMHYSLGETVDMIAGVPKMNRALRRLRPLGYEVKSALDIVQNKETDDTIVYTSTRLQPCAETFDPEHYRFVGPSVRLPENAKSEHDSNRPLVYVSLGTVINDRPGFYRTCIDALEGTDLDLLISCGKAFDASALGTLPANVGMEHYVNQIEVLARASLFITHCGMNSTSEGLYMGVPLLLFPLTGEQRAVARRVEELGAGLVLGEDAAGDPAALRKTVFAALDDARLAQGVAAMRYDLRSCPGPSGAADFIEQVAR